MKLFNKEILLKLEESLKEMFNELQWEYVEGIIPKTNEKILKILQDLNFCREDVDKISFDLFTSLNNKGRSCLCIYYNDETIVSLLVKR